MRGNAPLDSVMVSPAGESTAQSVLASASPPRRATSLNMMTAARCVTVTSVSLPTCTRMSERTTALPSPYLDTM